MRLNIPESVQKKLDIVSSVMIRVVLRASPGALIFGPGGHGKSFAVKQVMTKYSEARFCRHGSSATGRGLFLSFTSEPQATHVIEDMEDVFRGKTLNLCREALWGEKDSRGRMVRQIHWETNRGIESSDFDGGVIICSNQDLGNSPILGAVASRVRPMHYALSDEELVSMIRYLAQFPYTNTIGSMSPGERSHVAEHMISECLAQSRIVDLRNYVHACDAYLQDRHGLSPAPWTAVISDMMRAKVTDQYATRDAKVASKAWLAWTLRRLSRNERNRRWRTQTGETEMSYNRALKRAVTMGFDPQA